MAITNAQAWTVASTSGAASLAFGSVPTAGNIILCCANLASAVLTLAITDDINDGGSWATAKSDSQLNLAQTNYIFWKQVGTPSGGGKTVTVTPSVGSPICILFTAEFTAGAGVTWSADGTPNSIVGSSVTNPDPGAISISTGSLAIGYCTTSASFATAGSGFTRQATRGANNFDAVEDQVVSGTSVNCAWVHAADFTIAQGAAFKAASSASFNAGWATGATKTIGGAF